MKSPAKENPGAAKKRRNPSPGSKPPGSKRASLAASAEDYPKQHPVAQRLHETVCQTVTGIRFHIGALKHGLPPDCARLKTQLDTIESQLASASEELHEIIEALRNGKV